MFQPYVYMGMCPGSERHLRLVFVCKQMLALEGGSTLHTAHGMAGPCSEKRWQSACLPLCTFLQSAKFS